jgi:hypothetical protein
MEVEMTAATSEGNERPASRAGLVPFGPGVRLDEGEFMPATLTIGMGRWLHVSVPLGAFTVKEGKARFVASVDVVGLAGVGVGALAVRTARPIARAVADKIRGG